MRFNTLLALLAAVTVTLLVAACHPSRPVLDRGPKPDVDGTISGQVLANGDSLPVSGRRITAVNVATGARFETSTTSTGAYTVRVPKGVYRLELEVRSGEAVASAPDPTEVDPGDLDAGRNFALGVAAARN
jgi:hypothetical protein